VVEELPTRKKSVKKRTKSNSAKSRTKKVSRPVIYEYIPGQGGGRLGTGTIAVQKNHSSLTNLSLKHKKTI
jgi:hypothetical protein